MASSTKRRPAGKGSSTRKASPARPAPARRSGPAKPPRPSKARAAWSRLLASHGDEVLGAGFAVVALVGVLGIWLDVAGPVGRVVSFCAGVLFGLGRHLLPLACAVLAAALLGGRKQDARRLGIGLLLVGLAGAGLLHLDRHGPGLGSAVDTWRKAGGVTGGLVANPLRSAVGVWGGGLLLGGVGGVGLLVLFHLSFRQVAHAAAESGRMAGRALRRGIASLTTLSGAA
ncbi:MAG TPA: DNA translocase FtsK 4TM domain-containing protein, partial [Acidimicrobiia bacterium]|nr:DNA translocase FtsK 4TM domain-containing protein [Acidimicrobiia bacterium]